MSNKDKAILSLGKKHDPLDPPVSESSELIKLEEEFVSIAGLASKGREALVARLRDHMEKSKPAEYVPPAPTARQMTQLELEMEAGRRGVAKFEAQFASRPQPKPDPAEGFTTKVFRPSDHVPSFDSKDPAARTLK